MPRKSFDAESDPSHCVQYANVKFSHGWTEHQTRSQASDFAFFQRTGLRLMSGRAVHKDQENDEISAGAP